MSPPTNGGTATPAGYASSMTVVSDHDVEAQPSPDVNRVSYLRRFLDQAGVTPAVANHTYPGKGTAESPFVVDFLADDAYDPFRFSEGRKWLIIAIQATATLAVSFASSAYSGGIREIILDFRVSQEVAILGVSLFVLGFALGPLLWAPLSEVVGRQKLFFISYLALTAFNAGAAGANSMAALIVLRFFAGAFGSSPLTNAGGVIADIFSAEERGKAGAIFSMAPFLGPALGPIAGGFLGQSKGWRWVEGMIAIFCGVVWIASTVTYPETYAPVLLRKRAAKLSKMTGKVYVSKFDAHGPPRNAAAQFKVSITRPWILLVKEPIVLLTSIYIAIIYGTLYLCFAAFPIVYQLGRGWSPGIGGLAFIGIAIGMVSATLYAVFDNQRYKRVAATYPNGVAPPEERLPPAILGSILLPVGLFWFAWTNGPEIHWAVSIVGSGFFAAGILLVFLPLLNYLIDSYVIYAASVLAANSVLRSLFGAAFPLFTTYMYKDLGIHWASSIPAFLALACLPFPFLFYKYGAKIRARCEYASEASRIMEKMRAASAAAGPRSEEEAEAEAEAEVEVEDAAKAAEKKEQEPASK
ncbi:Major facilitator superfamily domain, general substrate transporter [Cordyceps fumosorosea ARSEF 2679]|uniref:Major facilitator superfamily domain, general substrate transporter n=1 Tax=Cordyceps fumosorosea (strain ARSEF 2679) TaxID=1081104 RepID=A0A167W0Q1_CORFA|nr:Major facilitator superfamily domain, general substrate transporter [Cordyceps fumosorosea ARSEF 2679]OAA63189.1 Major facilitator superfamily domain, general substrate transporter [Cordyceps fumosorosea ARSEF 2679]